MVSATKTAMIRRHYLSSVDPFSLFGWYWDVNVGTVKAVWGVKEFLCREREREEKTTMEKDF